MMPRTVDEILAHADELAARFEDYEPVEADEIDAESPARMPAGATSPSLPGEDLTTPATAAPPNRVEFSRAGSLAGMSVPSEPQADRPAPEDVFDHLRREDGEHVGYIEMTADGRFTPYDWLWVRRGEAMDLDEAEATLDEAGLRLLAEDWLLQEADERTGEAIWTRVRIREVHRDRVVVARAMEDLSADVAKAVNLVVGIELPLPTTRLRPAH